MFPVRQPGVYTGQYGSHGNSGQFQSENSAQYAGPMFATRVSRPTPQPMTLVQPSYMNAATHPPLMSVQVPTYRTPIYVQDANRLGQIHHAAEGQGPVHTSQQPNMPHGTTQGPFYTPGPFSSPTKHTGSGRQPPLMVSPSQVVSPPSSQVRPLTQDPNGVESRGPLHTVSQQPSVPPGTNQVPFYTHGPFSSSPSHPGSGGQPHPAASPPAPPPLFRPGPHTPLSKPAASTEAKLNKSEKEGLYRTFGVILQQHGPLEVTDSHLLSAFMSMSPWMRQGIKYLGGLKDFFRQAPIFNVKGDVVSLAWQEESKDDGKKGPSLPLEKDKEQAPPRMATPAGSSAAETSNPKDIKAAPKEKQITTINMDDAKKTTKQAHNQPANSSDTGEDSDDEWEGEDDRGWWLLDPLPGEAEEWNEISPLQGRLGGGYFDDFKKLEQKENKDLEEIQKKLDMTSSPTYGANIKAVTEEGKDRETRGEEKSPTSPASLSWEESAVAQEASLKQECDKSAKTPVKSWPSLLGDGPAGSVDIKMDPSSIMDRSVTEAGESRRTTKTAVKTWPSLLGDGLAAAVSTKTDSSSIKDRSVTEAGESRRTAEEVESDGNGDEQMSEVEELVYRSSSLHQADDDVILVEVVEGSTEEEETFVPGTGMDKQDKTENSHVVGHEIIDRYPHRIGSSDNELDVYVPEDIETSDEEEAKQLSNNNMDENLEVISKMIAMSVVDAVVALVGNDAMDKADETDAEHSQESNTSQASSKLQDETSPCIAVTRTTGAPKELGTSTRHVGIDGHPVSFRSIGVSAKPAQAHKAMCTREIKTRSCKINTIVVPLISRSSGTGEDPRLEEVNKKLAVEKTRGNILGSDVESLRDKLVVQKNQHSTQTQTLRLKLEEATRELSEYRRKHQSKTILEGNELRKTTIELKDTESRLNAARSKIARADKENSNLTRELEKTTRQLLDLEKSHDERETRQRACSRDFSTSTEELEPQKDLAAAGERSMLKLRARSAEQKVLELQYQYAMQSLNQALQESQYIFRMYGNNLLSSSHREDLRVKWMDYQMYIKEKTDEVATTYYSALKALQEDVPLQDAPRLNAQHIETFNPYRSPVKSNEFQFFDGMAQPNPSPVAGSFDLYAPLPGGQKPSAPAGVGMFEQGAAPHQPISRPPGLSAATGQSAQTQLPPGLANLQVTAKDLSNSFMQAQTQRSAPGKLMRRVPRKPPKACLAANFMSSMQHTTKVYGAKDPQGVQQLQQQVGGDVTFGLPQENRPPSRQSQASVHDWLDNMDAETTAQAAAGGTGAMANTNTVAPSAPPGFAGSRSNTPMDTPHQMEGVVSQSSAPELFASRPARPFGIGRGRPVAARSSNQMFAAPTSLKEGGDEAMDVGIKQEQPPRSPLDAGTTQEQPFRGLQEQPFRGPQDIGTKQELQPSRSPLEVPQGPTGGSSRNTSRSVSPFLLDDQQPKAGGLSRPSAGSLRGSPAGADADSRDALEKAGAFRSNTPSPSLLAKIRPSSTGDAVTAISSPDSQADNQFSFANPRSASVGDTVGPANQNALATEPSFGTKSDLTPYFSGSGFSSSETSSHGRERESVLPRFKARQMRMPYRRGVEGAGAPEPGPGMGDGSGPDKWTTQLSKRKRKALNLVEQQAQLMREYRTLTASGGDTKPSGGAKDRPQSRKQGSLDKLVNYLSKQFKNMTRKELTDVILQVRLDHNGSLSGIAMGTIISEASNYLSRSQKKKDRNPSEILALCAVCQVELEGDAAERKLECGHSFHNKCIKVWVNKEGTCPVCRKHTLFTEDFPRLS